MRTGSAIRMGAACSRPEPAADSARRKSQRRDTSQRLRDQLHESRRIEEMTADAGSDFFRYEFAAAALPAGVENRETTTDAMAE